MVPSCSHWPLKRQDLLWLSSGRLLAQPRASKREPSENDKHSLDDVCDYCQYEESQGQVGVVVLPAVPPGPTLVLPQDAGTVKDDPKEEWCRDGPQSSEHK